MATVRYMVNDVEESVDWYVSKLGFEVKERFGSVIAIMGHGDLELILAGPKTSAGQPMSDGTVPRAGGGWARFLHTVDDLEGLVTDLGEQGVTFRNDIVENQGRKQIICEDPSGNVIELFQAS